MKSAIQKERPKGANREQQVDVTHDTRRGVHQLEADVLATALAGRECLAFENGDFVRHAVAEMYRAINSTFLRALAGTTD